MSSDTAPIRGEVRLAGHRRVSHGLFLPVTEGLSDEEEFRRDLSAWMLVLPDEAVFTHLTAARLRRWRLPALPEQVPFFAAVRGTHRRPRRPGLICSRLVQPDTEPTPREMIDGLPVDLPEEVLLRCARDLGHLDLVVLIDSALALGDLDGDRMRELLNSRRPGVARLRAAYARSNRRAESAGETVLRVFHDAMEIPVQPQVDLIGSDSRLLGRADLLVVGTWNVHEYDGSGHRKREQHTSDLRRERRLAATPYVRRGFTLDDLLNHPGVVMHELDRALGRPHQAHRLRRWRRLMDHSMYSQAGRDRLLNRWRREMGVVDWA